jgi:hypothetical protein
VPTEDREYETEEENSENETEEDEYECPSPEYATHPWDYDYISEGEFFLFRQNSQLLIDEIEHAVEAVRDIDHQLRIGGDPIPWE